MVGDHHDLFPGSCLDLFFDPGLFFGMGLKGIEWPKFPVLRQRPDFFEIVHAALHGQHGNRLVAQEVKVRPQSGAQDHQLVLLILGAVQQMDIRAGGLFLHLGPQLLVGLAVVFVIARDVDHRLAGEGLLCPGDTPGLEVCVARQDYQLGIRLGRLEGAEFNM